MDFLGQKQMSKILITQYKVYYAQTV